MVHIKDGDSIAKIAEKMNGREYREELSPEETESLKRNGIVVAFGYSDDNVEFEGAVCDEVGSYQESETLFNTEGIIRNRCDEWEDCPNIEMLLKHIPHGTVTSKSESNGYAHEITADFPHDTFEIREDGEKYCKGIVFRLSDVAMRTEELINNFAE